MLITTAAGLTTETVKKARRKGVSIVREGAVIGVLRNLLPTLTAYDVVVAAPDAAAVDAVTVAVHDNTATTSGASIAHGVMGVVEARKRIRMEYPNTLRGKFIFVTGALKVFNDYASLEHFIERCGGTREIKYNKKIELHCDGEM